MTIGLCAAMMLERALRLIHELVATGADAAYLGPLLLQLAPYYLNLAIPAGLFAALVLLLSRLDERLELEAMVASGRSLGRIALPLVALSSIVAGASLVIGGFLEPVGWYNYRSARAMALNAGRVRTLEPRIFYRPAPGLALTFDQRGPGGRLQRVFVHRREGEEVLILTGRSGRLEMAGGNLSIQLSDGNFLAEGTRSDIESLAFREIGLSQAVELREERWRRGWDHKEMTLGELAAAIGGNDGRVSRHAARAELYSRLARAMTLPLIPLLVLPLAFTVKRGRRAPAVMLGAVLLIAFHHALNSAKTLGVVGLVDPALPILAVTLAFAAIVLAAFRAARFLPSHGGIASLTARLPALVPRLPSPSARLVAGRRQTIGFYLSRRLLAHVALALAAISALLLTVDILERGDDFVRRGIGLDAVLLTYVPLRLAPILQQALPMAALAGGLSGFASLSRSEEIVALRAAGISQFQILRRVLPVFLALSLAILFVAEVAAPWAQPRFIVWWTSRASSPSAPPAHWFRIGREIVRAGAAAGDGASLRDVTIFRRDPRGLLVERIAAASAAQIGGRWRLAGVERTVVEHGTVRVERRAEADWRVPLTAADVRRVATAATALSAANALRALELGAPEDRGPAYFRTRLWRLVGEPLSPIVMVLLSLPIAFVGSRGASWPALLYATGGGLLYLVGDGVLTVAAQVGRIAPMAGALAAPLLGLVAGWCTLVYTER